MMTRAPDKHATNGTAIKAIEVIGARTNNLKNVTCSIPHEQLTVVTGVSGSGKSSLAFDTLFAEGQRRYVESLSTYARQFIEQMRRPDVESIANIPPAIAIEQKNKVKNARSTVGTATEIYDYLRLLYAKIGKTFCPKCNLEVRKSSPVSVTERIMALPAGTEVLILSPVALPKRTSFESLKQAMVRAGFSRVWLRRSVRELSAISERQIGRETRILVIVDRIIVAADAGSRINESLETAFELGKGSVIIEIPDARGKSRRKRRLVFESGFACSGCGQIFKEPDPLLFSFNNPLGACPKCQGFGRIIGLDLDKVIPDQSLPLEKRPIVAWNTPAYEGMYDYMRESTKRYGLQWDVPFKNLSEQQRRIVIEGRRDFCGIRGFFDWLESKRYKVHVRVMLARFRSYTICPQCNGSRLVSEALNVRICGKTIAELCAMPIERLYQLFEDTTFSHEEIARAERIVQELRNRLEYLTRIGLRYLTLNRQTRTLSGGEAQRINLATALGSALTQTLYVLDEPTVGLHARDTDRLLSIIRSLRDKGNTMVVVEHDPTMIRGADHIIDLGPAAGERGGEILFAGTVEALLKHGGSLTAQYLNHRKTDPLPSRQRQPRSYIAIRGAREHNLKNLDVRIPLGILACLTGVSGSGKSTLMHDILFAGYRRWRGDSRYDVGKYDEIRGLEQIEDMILVDQSPLSRSLRSNPVTYLKAYDEIRKVFASSFDARQRGLSASDFSFNVPGGRCEQCKGTGITIVDMHFLTDVAVVCDACDGKRFKQKILEVSYKGLNVAHVLELTVEQAMNFFSGEPGVLRGLRPLADVGLGYLRLGQNTATLSGGEAQRLKLAAHLVETHNKKNYLILFDEPTTGLHFADLHVLIGVLNRLVDAGNSVLVIEHNLELMRHADYVIDLGPEGGEKGGYIVAQGQLRQLLKSKKSFTAQFLREYLSVRSV